MKHYILLLAYLLTGSTLLEGQCTLSANNDDYTVEIEISAIELITTQNGPTCNAQVVLEYDISISDGGPSWWNGDLYTLQGRLVCDNAEGSSFFTLPNGGGTGTTTSALYSYNDMDCDNLILNCNIEIEAQGPGLNFDGLCGSVSLASLPVSFSKVYYQETNGTYSIHWHTEVETNSDRYEVIRSSNGHDWEKIHEQKSANSLNGSRYSAVIPHTTHSYYRVKNIDFDGLSQMSKVITVDTQTGTEVTVFPNPVREQLTIFTGSDLQQQLAVFDITGRTVVSQSVVGQTNVEVSDLAPGTYTYVLSSKHARGTVGRFVKL